MQRLIPYDRQRTCRQIRRPTNRCSLWRLKRRAMAGWKAEFRSAPRSLPDPVKLLSRGHNRRVQQGDPSIHGETDAFRTGRPPAELSQPHYGHHARSMLVLQRTRAPIPYRHARRRRKPDVCRRPRLAARKWRGGHRSRQSRSAANCWKATSPSTRRSGTKTSAKSSSVRIHKMLWLKSSRTNRTRGSVCSMQWWWRRRESNPRPKSLSAGRIHAVSGSACFRSAALRTDKMRMKLVR